MTQTIQIRTQAQDVFVDITRDVETILRKSVSDEGICLVFVPHTTCGLTINENADPDVQTDMLASLQRQVPREAHYRHMEGNSAAHIRASMMGFSLQVPFKNGRLLLGIWQGIYLCEFDGPRNRNVVVQIR